MIDALKSVEIMVHRIGYNRSFKVN